ncbi:MAG: AraC family ligand binding domain-containing protein [Eubacteriales bacterium]
MKTGICRERVKFWRHNEFGDLELLRASYITHSFSRHIHEGYAIGVIERGVEDFEYRRATHAAVSGSVVVINPGEVHTGRRGCDEGWTYRMLYPGVPLLQEAACEVAGRFSDIPFFPEPIIHDPCLAGLILHLHMAFEQPA